SCVTPPKYRGEASFRNSFCRSRPKHPAVLRLRLAVLVERRESVGKAGEFGHRLHRPAVQGIDRDRPLLRLRQVLLEVVLHKKKRSATLREAGLEGQAVDLHGIGREL